MSQSQPVGSGGAAPGARDDALQLVRFSRADQTALPQMYRTYSGPMFATAYSLLGDRELAAEAPNVEFVDGGALITPERDWSRTAPCLPDEPCTGPEVGGVRHNVIRSADTVHFCPVPNSVSDPCPSYSSGAYRYASTIADAIERRR